MAFSRRNLAAVVLMVSLAVVSHGYALRRLVRGSVATNHDPASYDRRTKDLRALLPLFGVVGYLGDDSNVLSRSTVRRPYYLTQYALAPVVVDRTPTHRVVVANVQDETTIVRAMERHALRRVMDLDGRLHLLRSSDP